jgi:hypothetical protein
MDWGSIGTAFTKLFMDVAPQVAGAAAGGAVSSAMAGKGASTSFEGLDQRTGTGQEAEQRRLNASKLAMGGYKQAMRGKLDPREEELIRRQERSSSAASGMLETGGHGVREQNAIDDRVLANKKYYGGLVDSLTGGYDNLSVQKVDNAAQPNLWGSLLAPAAAQGVEKGFKGLADNFSTDADKKKKDPYVSLSDQVRSGSF